MTIADLFIRDQPTTISFGDSRSVSLRDPNGVGWEDSCALAAPRRLVTSFKFCVAIRTVSLITESSLPLRKRHQVKFAYVFLQKTS